MTNPNPYTALIAKVDAGEVRLLDFFDLAPASLSYQAYLNCLNSAKALHDALLPGWDICLNTYEDESFEAAVAPALEVRSYSAVSHLMARAWLLAILKAKEAEHG